jgi:N-acetylmuramoyl-L-alanine amidase CwlA
MKYEFIVNHIPVDGDNRPGIISPKTSFTVHNTGNTATDEQERNNIARPDNQEDVGFNFVCDEDSVTETIPDNEVTYHSGNQYGNYHSVSLEVAERPGAEDVAIEFISDYFVKKNWNIDVLTNHKYWNGKNCPSQILPHWDKFVAKILKKIQEKRGGEIVLDKVVTYVGDADIFPAILVAQKNKCGLYKKSDWDASGLKANQVIVIGGKPNSDRFITFKDAAGLV